MFKVAKVAVPIFLDREFDYSFSSAITPEKGMRVLVDFNGRKMAAIVVALSKTSKFKRLKPIIGILDIEPVLNVEHILFADKLSKIYPYARADFLFMMLPPYLRKPRKVYLELNQRIAGSTTLAARKSNSQENVFIKADSFLERYSFWKDKIFQQLEHGSVLICFPQIALLEKAKQYLEKDFFDKLKVMHSQQKEKELFLNWEKSRENSLILGTRAALFYYPKDLKLLIVEEENSPYYFQKEKPYHNLIDLAFAVSKVKAADLILSADHPSLATYRLIKKNKVKLHDKGCLPKKIEIVNIESSNKKKLIGPVLTELLRCAMQTDKKAVILWNRKGFARLISCSVCGHAYKCKHCSGFLQSFKAVLTKETEPKAIEGICPYCHRRQVLSLLCGKCSNGYLKSSGYGIERVGSILQRIFPEVKITNLDEEAQGCGIILSTSKILRYVYQAPLFDTGFLLDADISLARTDYAATLDTFFYFKKLSLLFKEKLYVFTRNRGHYIFEYLNKEWEKFYEAELNFRKALCLPPYGLIVKITLRARERNKLLKKANDLYNRLQKSFEEVYGPFEEYPFKLRDKFRYSITVKTKRNFASRHLIKEEIKSFRTQGVQLAVSLR